MNKEWTQDELDAAQLRGMEEKIKFDMARQCRVDELEAENATLTDRVKEMQTLLKNIAAEAACGTGQPIRRKLVQEIMELLG